jgi:predicted ester cyclase
MRETIGELVAAWQAGDAHRASAFFASQGEYREADGEAIVGRDALLARFQRFFRDGPPWQFDVDEIIAEDERAAVFYRFALKTSSGWQERAGCALVRRESGLLTQWREYSTRS